MPHALLLGVHVAAGTLGLLLGPVVMLQDSRRLAAGRPPTAPAGIAYHWTVLVVCVTAVGLVVLSRADLWWLVPVAAFSYGLVVLGRVAAVRRFRGWSHAYVHGLGGSYIALVTALVVVALTVDGPVHGAAEVLPWALPVLVGTFLIEWWRRRLLRAIEPRPRGLAP